MSSENKMGVMPINKLILSMSIPMMLSMLIQALYNIVDSMFVAQISENALTAVSLAFPAQNLMIAVATGTGVGINATLSRSLGEKNFQKANRIAIHALFLAFMSFLAFAVFGLFFAEHFSWPRPGTRRSWRWAPPTSRSVPSFPLGSSARSPLSGSCSPPAGPFTL